MLTTSSLKKQLTFKQKRKLMLKQLEAELYQYKDDPKMAWWVMTLERKIKEFHEYNKAS